MLEFFKRGEMMGKIVVNPEILAGKPIIEGTRLSVEHVLGLLNSGMSHAQLLLGARTLRRQFSIEW